MITVVDFPTFKISEQIFYVPGGAIEGGLTAGGARILTPEPGGIAMLEIRPALQGNEFAYPLSAWLMSKTNGEPLRVRLAPTPQVMRLPSERPWDNNQPWSHGEPWAGDTVSVYSAASLKGTTQVTVNMTDIGAAAQPGHVIGHEGETYLIDSVAYNADLTSVVIRVKPPLRRDIAVNDICLFRPYFTGVITNGREIIQSYEAVNNGHIQMPKIIMAEARL